MQLCFPSQNLFTNHLPKIRLLNFIESTPNKINNLSLKKVVKKIERKINDFNFCQLSICNNIHLIEGK